LNGFVERYNRTYQEECLAWERPKSLEEARRLTETFKQHDNFQRPNQALSCENYPPRVAFPLLPPLPSLPNWWDSR
jgi:hypothetical protein